MDVKANLKEARDAIKSKNFESAMKICKLILKEDKSNYMGLVFLGISLQELGQLEQAPKAFQKAIQLNAANPLAWNGLANFHEKTGNLTEVLPIYKKIIELDNGDGKVADVLGKVSGWNGADTSEKCLALDEILGCGRVSGELLKTTQEEIVRLVKTVPKPEPKLLDIYENCLVSLLSMDESSELAFDYLKLLSDRRKFAKFVEIYAKTSQNFENSQISELVCTVFVELYAGNDEIYKTLTSSVENFPENPQKTFPLLAKSIVFAENSDFSDMRATLEKAISLQPNLDITWRLYTECLIKLHLYSDAVQAYQKLSQKQRNFDKNLCLCLSKSTQPEHWKEAVNLCEKFLEGGEEDDDVKRFLVESYINLGEFAKAKVGIMSVRDKIAKTLLKAKLSMGRGNFDEAQKILENSELGDSPEYWLSLGDVFWKTGQFQKCLVPFLKAAKLDPSSYVCFLNLGNYYNKTGDLDKARRCYEKSFKLNRNCSQAGSELSKIYRKQQKWDENLNLLENLTSGKICSTNKWAYMQLGIHYLEQEDYGNAITYFRFVIRAEPENGHCWECLADAYLARGAYTSSIKSYQKASEIKPDSLYPMLQVANIKKLLGEYVEARAVFEEIFALNRNYVPALKGFAETCLYEGKSYHKRQLHGMARDSLQNALDKITTGLQSRPDLSCLWKIAGDSVSIVANLPEKFSCLLVLSCLVGETDQKKSVIVEQEELFNLASRCYCKAISLTDENILIYHDLAVCYLSYGQFAKCQEKRQSLLRKALEIIKYCVSNNPSHWQHWNVLGNIAFLTEPKNLSLAQHAFIKAATLERNSAVVWTNLGALYLHVDDVKLANEAFAQAQRGEPSYVNSWIGQALIAETIGASDAMDLFRHSTQLAAHQQGAIGYAYWVCKTLLESPPDVRIYSIHNMYAVPVACDALTWYTENDPNDACAWNMLGLLRERMGLKVSACHAFRKALHCCSTNEDRDRVNVNYGRSLVANRRYSEAVEAFKNVREATFGSGSGLALALFKDKRYEESYEAYGTTLDWLAEDEGCQSDLLVALASMAYLYQGSEPAKTLLLQSTDLKPRSAWGLYATLSLGLLDNDLTLAKLVLKELEQLKDDKTCLPHYALLLSYTYLLRGETTKLVRELSKLVHRHPDLAPLWLQLSTAILRLSPDAECARAAAKCARIAMSLGQTNMDVTKVLCVVSLAALSAGDVKRGLVAAQRAIHYYPDVAEGWSLLLFALKLMGKDGLRLVDVYRSLKCSQPLIGWFENNLL